MPSIPASTARRASSGEQMPLSRIGSFVSERSQTRSSQVRLWLPKIIAHSPVAASTSSSGGAASLPRKTGSLK